MAVTRPHSLIRWMKTLMLLVLGSALTVFFCAHFSASSQGTDFPDFYSASRLLIAGHGHELYDVQVQRQFQSRYLGRVGTLYIHPPFEALFYLGVAWLPLLFVTLAFTALRCHRSFAAGCWLGLGLFKFHLVLPLALVLALQKGRNGFLRGFALMAVALAAVS